MSEITLKIGLSLSGGGARGIAHIGVLQALLDNGIEPQYLAGASAGSVVGVLYASGFSPEEIMGFIKESSFLRLVKIGLPSGGFTKLSYLSERLAEVIELDDFSGLKKPLWVAITNLNTGHLVMRSSGPLFEVIVASCSIPLVFQPVAIEGEYYVDGGLLCNLPVSPLLEEAEFTIGVNVVPESIMGSEELNSMVGVAYRSFDLSILANSRPEAERCDFLIEPEGLADYSVFQFSKYEALYQLGYQSVEKQLAALRSAMEQKEAAIMKNY